ncbi:MAG: hypothetical protein J0L62_00915 [Bacteroidetes bacterium]|nr:hypothetical protein [Bacteroidota bacterium]
MIRKLMLPLLAALGFAALGCEKYTMPDVDNSAPGLTITEPTVTVITDTLKVSGVATDDKYVNFLTFRLLNKDENNSLDYTYRVRWSKTNGILPVSNVPFSYVVPISGARLIDGNYKLEVEVGDVQGLKNIQSLDLQLTKAGVTNVDSGSVSITLDSTLNEFDGKWDNRKFISVRTRKAFDIEEVTTNENTAESIDLVLAVIENGVSKADNDTLLMSPLEAKNRSVGLDSASHIIDTKKVAFTKEINIRNTTLTVAQLDTINTSRKVRREYTAGTGDVKYVKPQVGKVYAIGLENNIYVLAYVKSYNQQKGVFTIRFHHKRFYP